MVLGLEGAGKSLLVKQLKQVANYIQNQSKSNIKELQSGKVALDLPPQTNPTTGFDTVQMKVNTEGHGKQIIYLNEVGSAMISAWHKFLQNSKSIIVNDPIYLYCSV